MNTFTAKKLGEVLAFARVLSATLEKGGEALARAFPQDELGKIRTENERHVDALKTDALYSDVRDAMLEKADKTAEKLTAMQDLYLTSDDDWDDPAELMEWLGFFEGAAVVHWSLVVGASGTVDKAGFTDLAESGIALHSHFLAQVSGAIKEHGAERAGE